MRKLIRCRATKAFLTKDGRWTAEIAHADDFADDDQARQLIQQLQVTDIELYYHFHEYEPTDYDFTIPLNYPLTPASTSSASQPEP